MSVYLVSYDLNAPDKDYQRLIDAIGRYGNVCRVLKSQWAIQSNNSAEQIFNDLVRFIDGDDELFVCELNQNYAGRLSQEKIDWFQSFPKPLQLLPRLLG